MIDKLLLLDQDFVPEGKGYSLYLRPTLIGTTASLGVGTPDRLFCLLLPLLLVLTTRLGSNQLA